MSRLLKKVLHHIFCWQNEHWAGFIWINMLIHQSDPEIAVHLSKSIPSLAVFKVEAHEHMLVELHSAIKIIFSVRLVKNDMAV